MAPLKLVFAIAVAVSLGIGGVSAAPLGFVETGPQSLRVERNQSRVGYRQYDEYPERDDDADLFTPENPHHRRQHRPTDIPPNPRSIHPFTSGFHHHDRRIAVNTIIGTASIVLTRGQFRRMSVQGGKAGRQTNLTTEIYTVVWLDPNVSQARSGSSL